MQTQIELAFGDGDYIFRLPLSLINELQKKTGLGIGALFAKLVRGRYPMGDGTIGNPAEADYSVADVLEPIRLGLIGGGKGRVNGEEVNVDPLRARELVEAYCYPARPLSEAWTLSTAILMACVEGYQPKKKGDHPEAESGTDGSTTGAASPTAESREQMPEQPATSPSTNTPPSCKGGRKRTKRTRTK